MPPRVLQFRIRNPLVGALVVVLLLALLAVVFVAGAAVLAGVAVLGGAAVAVRRLTRRSTLARPPAVPPALDPGREVFAAQPDDTRRLPPA